MTGRCRISACPQENGLLIMRIMAEDDENLSTGL
jgi:hypothetical protein